MTEVAQKHQNGTSGPTSTAGQRWTARGRAPVGVVIVALALLGAACSSSTASSTSSSTTTATTTVPASTTTTGASVPPTSAATGAVVVAASSRGSVGVVLTDGVDGPTLYRYTPDGTGPSTCTSVCAQSWPPLTVPSASMVSPGSGVAGTALGTVPRSGGTLQVTYKGMPLYRFAEDTSPTQTTGQGVGGVWFVVHPADPAQGPAKTTTSTSSKISPY